jgi:uncharacterized protein involved in exopolysaccharide biosynthesis
LPAIWFFSPPVFNVQGAVRIAPVVESILENEVRGGSGSGYADFVNTQVTILTSGPVLQRIADDLSGRDLRIFSGQPQTPIGKLQAIFLPRTSRPDPAAVLKNAVAGGVISAGQIPHTELMAVTMKRRTQPKPSES